MNDNLQNALARLIKVVTYTFIGVIIITIIGIILSTRETNKEEQIREKIINRMIEKLDSLE